MIGAEFREARQRAGLSFRRCAAQLGVSLTTIQRWESGGTAIPSDAAEAITSAGGDRTPAQSTAYAVGRMGAIVERGSGTPLARTTAAYLFSQPGRALPILSRIAAQLGTSVRDDVADVLASIDASTLSDADRESAFASLGYYHERGAGSQGATNG